MIQEITKYPTTPSLEFGANVRHFNEELFTLIQDLKDTMEANSLNALAAFQITSPLSVIVVKKDDDEFLELINPRILTREGKVTPTETTAYFPGLSAKTNRYEKIKVMYEDRGANQQFLEADGDLSITIQRKMDYMYGSNFRVRLDEEEQKVFDSKLEFGTDSITQNDCPTVFKRDRLLQLFKFLFVAALFGTVSKFFVSEETLSTVISIENYAMISLLILIVIYFFYAQYEGKQYEHCTSCQIGNIIGTSVIALVKLSVLFLVNYFLLW
ncbi:Peptide deformylase [Epsilonproteobacteria bacterium SCGC AD-311-C15]|jgi:peptide deformylase|nr:Peptide deformylase [Epsilonproteobacteria bacterium SCGC AD-311-C15]